jgi:hypothetical protein
MKNSTTTSKYPLPKDKIWTRLPARVKALEDNAPKYKVYTALLTQTGTDAPVATILENTANLTVTYTYYNPGIYLFSFVKLSSEKIVIDVYTKYGTFGNTINNNYTINPTSVNGTISVGSSGPGADGSMVNLPIEIRVYN